jgi:hypothetical protein
LSEPLLLLLLLLLLPPVDFAVETVLDVVDSFEEPESLEPESFEELDSFEPDSFEELESLVTESFEELESFEPDSLESDESDELPPAPEPLAAELETRESVLYQPLPLNTIPTG